MRAAKRVLRKNLVWVVTGTALVSNLTGLAVGARLISPGKIVPSVHASTTPLVRPDAQALQKNAENFRAVVKMVGPSVLTIKVSGETPAPQKLAQRHGGGGGRLPQNDSMEELLRRFGFSFDMPSPALPPSGGAREGSGSGFVVDKRGYVVTNYHVVKGASKITALLPDDESEEIPAKIVGVDPRSDLAVVKIETKKPLTAIDWADSAAVEVGDPAIAIGSPFMLTHSVTAGIVSAMGRNASNIMGSAFGQEMLQTDAAINPGNSGGPLCTADGKVMGVNTAIFTQSGGYMGIGFAIPATVAKTVVDTLIKDGHIVRGWLGVAIQQADKELTKEMGIESAAVIHEVTENSPADKAGLRAGDVIVQIRDQKIAKVNEVQKLIAALHPGQHVSVKVVNYDDRKARTIDVKIGEWTDPKEG